MTSKADQLFLELCLLRLRYLDEEIEQVARLKSMQNEAVIRDLVMALREIRLIISDEGPSKRMTKKSRAGTFREKPFVSNHRTKSDTKSDSEPFLNLAKSLMKK
jgi:hypothetical protein